MNGLCPGEFLTTRQRTDDECGYCGQPKRDHQAPAGAPPATLRAADWKAEADELVSEVRRSEVLTGKDKSTHFVTGMSIARPAAAPPAPPAEES